MHNKYWVFTKWFLLANLAFLAVPLIPFMVGIFIEFTLHIKLGWEPYAVDGLVMKTPFVSVPLSLIVAIYQVRSVDREEHTELKPRTTGRLLRKGLQNFILSTLVLYGLLTLGIVLFITFSSSDNSLIGIWFIIALPAILLASVVYALFSMRHTKAILIFLAITILPVILYKSYYSIRFSTFSGDVTHMQRGTPTEAEWRAFFDKYGDDLVVTGGNNSMLSMVLYIPSIPQDILIQYAESDDVTVLWSLAKNPSLPEEYMRAFVTADNYYLRERLAENPNLPQDVIAKLLQDKEPSVVETIKETLFKKALSKEPKEVTTP